MTALSFLPSSALVAAFPQTRSAQPSIRRAFVQERKAAWKARLAAETAKRMMIQGRAQSYAFATVTVADRDSLNAGPVVLLARRASGEIAGVEAFEIESRARLNAWIDRAAVVSDITLCAYRLAATRIERSAVVADLTDKPSRRSAFVTAGRYDRRAIMVAAIAQAKASRAVSGSTWGAALSAALRDVWQAAKAAGLTVCA